MGNGSRFASIIEKVPVDNDKLIGQAVSWFIQKQEPENVRFIKYSNGYKIEVLTDNENAKEAKQFWDENVHPELEGRE